MKKLYSLLLVLIIFGSFANAQSQLGEIRGKVIDAKTKKPMDYVSVSIYLFGVLKATAMTDDDGNYIVKTLTPGDEYIIKVAYIGYRPSVINEVSVTSDNISFVNINMEASDGKVFDPVVVTRKKPLVDPEGKGGTSFGNKELVSAPNQNLNNIANLAAGVESRGGGTPNFLGARADGTAYYIDGIRVNGNTSLPSVAVDNVQIITGGTPAQYGDFVGGAIAQTTRSPSKNFIRQILYRTASPFSGYLDNTQTNSLQAFVSGPIKIINKDKGDKERVLIGFSLIGQAQYQRDGNPSAVDVYKVKDDVLRNLQQNPLTISSTGFFLNSAEFLTKNDLEKVSYNQNVAGTSLILSGSFTYSPSNNTDMKLGYYGSYNSGRQSLGYGYSLMDYQNNRLATSYTIRPYIQFTQRFKKNKSDEESKKDLISNAYYTVRLSYERVYSQVESPDFGSNFFSYGYVGQFKTYSMPVYQQVTKSNTSVGQAPDKYTYKDPKTGKIDTLYLTSYMKQTGSTIDTLTQFNPSTLNPVKANYDNVIYDYYSNNNMRIASISQLQSLGGVANGYDPLGVYSNMWQNVGTNQSGFGKSQFESYQLYVMSEASVGTNPKAKHDLQFGFTYEQQVQRGYSFNPAGLWILMNQSVNNQFSGNDSSKAILNFNSNGVFQDTVRFNPLIVSANQSTFDKNLRNQLISEGATDVYGNPITQYSKIDVNLYNPSTYSLKMFSANDLLNNGNRNPLYLSYYGYDYLGNVVNGKQSFDKFLNDPQNRTIGAFEPIYMAAWVQDKFVFKDLIVRIGFRMERYDANQQVLKDPYSLAPLYTAGDVRRGNLLNLASAIPSNISNSDAVYIDNAQQIVGSTHISGFRDGNNWYDANGNPVTDPTSLYKNSITNYNAQISHNTPFLVNPGQTLPSAASFTDYVPDVKILPRVWFSFPISTTAQFFGTYDVLAQRPTQGLNVARYDDYYYLNNRLTETIGNPNLQMTQKTNYEIGFRQQVGDNAALGIIASYSEFRNLLQIYKYSQAWPNDYTTYGNLDFSTTKSIRIEYELRDIGNFHLQANYTLQFAEGTGSNANSSAVLVSSGNAQQRNVFPLDFDTRNILKGILGYGYKHGKDYNGPIVAGRKILEDAGINLIFNYSSGRPYTQANEPIPTAQEGIAARSTVKGTIDGARLPSQFFTDVNIEKVFNMRTTDLNQKTTMYQMRVYLEVTNLLNAANVLSVYQYTGSAYDDGYINSPAAVSVKNNATNTQSFIDLYNTKVVNPGSFAFPRMVRLGISLQF